MPDSYGVISSHPITPGEYAALIRDLGGVVVDAGTQEARVSEDDKHIWLYLNNNLLKDYDEEDSEPVVRALGGEPRSYIQLDVSRTEGSERLALDFAVACASRWPCVVDNLRDRVFSAAELRRMQEAAIGFTD